MWLIDWFIIAVIVFFYNTALIFKDLIWVFLQIREKLIMMSILARMIHRSIILICPVCNSTHYWACFPHQNKRIFRNSFFSSHDWYRNFSSLRLLFLHLSRSLRCISKSFHVFSCLQLIFVFADSWLVDSCKKILLNLDWITPFPLVY